MEWLTRTHTGLWEETLVMWKQPRKKGGPEVRSGQNVAEADTETVALLPPWA